MIKIAKHNAKYREVAAAAIKSFGIFCLHLNITYIASKHDDWFKAHDAVQG